MLTFYGVVLPEFEDNDYIEVNLTPEQEIALEDKWRCRIIEVGNPPFTSKAIAHIDTFQVYDNNPFNILKICPITQDVVEDLYAVCHSLGIAFNNHNWYLAGERNE